MHRNDYPPEYNEAHEQTLSFRDIFLTYVLPNRFLWAIAGDLPGFEEASRALYAGDGERFRETTRSWPRDVRDHALSLSAPCFGAGRRQG